MITQHLFTVYEMEVVISKKEFKLNGFRRQIACRWWAHIKVVHFDENLFSTQEKVNNCNM